MQKKSIDIILLIKCKRDMNVTLSACFFLCVGGCPRGVTVKVMDCGIVVSEFVFQARYYIHFRANTLGKSMYTLILPAMG